MKLSSVSSYGRVSLCWVAGFPGIRFCLKDLERCHLKVLRCWWCMFFFLGFSSCVGGSIATR